MVLFLTVLIVMVPSAKLQTYLWSETESVLLTQSCLPTMFFSVVIPPTACSSWDFPLEWSPWITSYYPHSYYPLVNSKYNKRFNHSFWLRYHRKNLTARRWTVRGKIGNPFLAHTQPGSISPLLMMREWKNSITG